MDGAEEAGAIVTGALAARAVEPRAGEGQHTDQRHCLNCTAVVPSNYCPECGQPAHVHRSLGAFAHDLLHGVLHLEGKIWRTLPKLLFRPGELTRRYIAGERARFVSPLAVFLFSVFLMFGVMNFLGSPEKVFAGEGGEEVRNELRGETGALDERIEQLKRQRDRQAARGGTFRRSTRRSATRNRHARLWLA